MREAGAETSNKARWLTAVIAAVLLGVAAPGAAALAGLYLSPLADWRDGQVNGLTVFIAVFVCGLFIWHRQGRGHRSVTLMSGAVAGVTVGLAAYPATLLLAEFGRTAGIGLAGMGERLLRVGEVSVLLIISTGFVAAIVMGLAGVMLAWLLSAVQGEKAGTGDRLARPWATLCFAVVLVLAAAFSILSALPLDRSGIDRVPASFPAQSHSDALAMIEAVREAEAALALHDKCGSTVLTHEARTPVAVVYLHGLTSCPAQGDELAGQIFALGHNVYVPRMPGHGLADRMTGALAEVVAEDFLSVVSEAVDIAHGLGDTVIVAGLSGGGTMAAWLVQNRGDIDRVVAMAPFLAPFGLPGWSRRAAMNLLLHIPNIMVLWDPRDIEGPPGMEYAYPQMPTRTVAQFLRLGEALAEQSSQARPVGGTPGVLLNDSDTSIDNHAVEHLMSNWEVHGARVDFYRILAERSILHDMIDPRQPGANTAFVYPLVLEIMGLRARGAGR